MEFTLTNPEGTKTWSPTASQLWEAGQDLRWHLCGLSVGQSYTDHDGYTWERIA